MCLQAVRSIFTLSQTDSVGLWHLLLMQPMWELFAGNITEALESEQYLTGEMLKEVVIEKRMCSIEASF